MASLDHTMGVLTLNTRALFFGYMIYVCYCSV